MYCIKSLLTGLFGVALCLADINGIVTDTGSTPIAGAVVRLEKGNQSVTTGADGLFTFVANSAILPGVNQHPRMHNLSATVQNGLLWVNVTKKSVVEITTFNLVGKALSTVQTPMIAGTNLIKLPFLVSGIYLYKVKLDYGEVVLKSNSVSGVLSKIAAFSHDVPSKLLAKQSKAKDSIVDIITATKTGFLNYRMDIYNADTTGIKIKMIVSAGTVTDVDGNEYQTVKIGNQEWTVENLRTTKYNDGSVIPLVTDSATWSHMYDSSLTTAAYCYYNNTTNADSIKKFGALYNWHAVKTKILAPKGWHIPDTTEWHTLETFLGGVNVAGGKLKETGTSHWDTPNKGASNDVGFSALPGGYRERTGEFLCVGYNGCWWSFTENDTSTSWWWTIESDSNYFYHYGNGAAGCGLSVRCVRD